LAGDAAILVNPDSVDSIAGGMYDVIRNHGRRKDIVATGQERIKQFSWDRCAAETLSAIEAAAQ
jgi:glycosyltransferase involved in cell wall biosynthesis